MQYKALWIKASTKCMQITKNTTKVQIKVQMKRAYLYKYQKKIRSINSLKAKNVIKRVIRQVSRAVECGLVSYLIAVGETHTKENHDDKLHN